MKRALFSIVAVAIALGVLETGARLVEHYGCQTGPVPAESSGWQATFFRTFHDWHEPDPDLLWRFKANLEHPLITTNSSHLLGGKINRKKSESVFRILLLGDSSPVGIGLSSRKQAFGEQLCRMLDVVLTDYSRVELINTTVPGYSSEQIRVYLESEGWQFEPDLTILYCGNNDASISGYLTDRELLQQQSFGPARKLLSELALYRMARVALTSANAPEELQPDMLRLRVSTDRFHQNLKSIAALCAEHSSPLVIVKPPVPLLWPALLQFKVLGDRCSEGRPIMPEAMRQVLAREIKYCFDPVRFSHLLDNTDVFTQLVIQSAFTDSLAPVEAISLYSRQLDIQPDDAVTINNLGVSYWQAGNYRQAETTLRRARETYVRTTTNLSPAFVAGGAPFLYNLGVNLLSMSERDTTKLAEAYTALDSALQADYFSLRIKAVYLDQIDRLEGLPNVFLYDPSPAVRSNGAESLFIDHCHPTVEGHRLIATGLFQLIMRDIVQ